MTDDPNAADRDLDRRLRHASEALLALAGPERHTALAARVEAELSRLDGPRALETPMTTDTDDDAAPTSIAPPGRTEDSGLHDIKALAKDTRRRISRRITSQHDVDEAMLSSSHSGLRAVALPEPAMIVAFPEAPASLADVKPASPAAVAAIEAAVPASAPARKRTALWLGGGAVALAAAAAVAVIAGGGGGSGSKQQPESSGAVAVASGSAADRTAAPVMTPVAAPAAVPTVAAEPAAAAPSEPEVDKAEDKPAPPPTRAGADDKRADPARSKPEDKVTKADDKGARGDAKPGKIDPKTDVKPGGGTQVAVKPAGGGAAGGGEKSIEDLLNDASGGGKPKDDGGGAAPTGPVKSGLEPKEIKAGMSAVAGAAQGCYGKHGEAGHVKIKAVVAPSGDVSKVDATGEFAGTPTGACVAAAVKGAHFPAWTGAPMTITYSFTLQE